MLAEIFKSFWWNTFRAGEPAPNSRANKVGQWEDALGSNQVGQRCPSTYGCHRMPAAEIHGFFILGSLEGSAKAVVAEPFTLLKIRNEVEYVENAKSEFVDVVVGNGCGLRQDESWRV